MVDSKLQEDLFDIVAIFRSHKYVLIVDVAKMYRQVKVIEEHTPFQRILGRNSTDEEIKTYELTTVTYGTASASYLAIKALQELAGGEHNMQSKGSHIILRDFYMDDLLTGTDSFEEAKKIQSEVNKLLSKGKLELRKWASNEPSLLKHMPNSITLFST